MGGVISSGQNNDDLIDNLLEADYIKSSIIERVFRAVDRAEYYLPEARSNAYKDLAWKNGNLHISAPCIYSEVMEGLCLEPGLSFLNLGCGTGYLSTMVGLILGSYGVNHGVEYYADVVQYANTKLEDFRKFSGAIDEFNYCEPKFIQGNCLCLSSDFFAQYDRVYCGAACPSEYEDYMKNLLKVKGILVMPLDDQLLQIKRTSETNWTVKPLLPVSFASMIQPPQNTQDIQMFDVETPSLQSLCRAVIRNILRKNVELEHPPVKRKIPAQKGPKKKRVLRRLVVPLFESEDSSDEDRHVRIGGNKTVTQSQQIPTSERNVNTGESTNPGENNVERPEGPQDENAIPSIREIHNVFVDVLNVLRREIGEGDAPESHRENEEDIAEVRENLPSSSVPKNSDDSPQQKREKSDSGVDDEIVETHSASSDDENEMKLDIASSSDDDHRDKRNKRVQTSARESRCALKWRRIESGIHRFVADSSSENDNEEFKIDNEMRMYESPYTEHMRAKIQQLPLPTILKRYINFYREF